MTPRYPVSSVERALDLLALLEDSGPARLSDLAVRLEVANSTAHRLLDTLQHRGFVEQDVLSRRYRLGPALARFGRAALLHHDVVTWARPAMVEVVTRFDETVHLGVLEGPEVRYLDAIESTRAVRVAARTGQRSAAHWTSTGKVLLAARADEEVRWLLGNRSLPPRTSRSIVSVDMLLANLEVCRRVGYAVTVGESEDDVVSVAIPIRDMQGNVIAAIGCAAPHHRLDARDAPDVAASMQRAVEALSG